MPNLVLLVSKEPISLDLARLPKGGVVTVPAKAVAITCPHCGRAGTFEPTFGGSLQHQVANSKGTFAVNLWYGLRHCPNPACRAPVFLIEQDGRAALTVPAQTIDFDASAVPPKVADSLREAIECHAAGCFRGAALLARRALEEICEDRGARGGDLRKRIAALGALITVPKALIDAMDAIRLLGNDAAHVEAKTYDDLGKDEVEIAIALCKELVKAAYQYEDLLGKIRAFQRPAG